MIRLAEPEIGEEEIQAVAAVLRSGYLVQGRHVEDFEQRAAAYLGVEHAVAVSSGTAALHLALLALGIGHGDEVLLPDLTFPATANVVALCGATPVPVDVELSTFNLDPACLENALTEKTRAVMPVHLFGLAADMASVSHFARQHSLWVIEDAACALGSLHQGTHCGTLGALGCFSFHPRKAITTGEGGMIVTHDSTLASSLRRWRNHGMASVPAWERFQHPGLNYRLTDMQGALGAAQMTRLDALIAKRRSAAQAYHALLSGVPGVVAPHASDPAAHVWQSYVVLLPEQVSRDAVIAKMRSHGVETTLGAYAVSAQPAFAWMKRSFPNARYAYLHSLSLPMHSRLAPQDQEQVAACLRQALQDAA
ncbi:MAG: DegT/DnrJ/EryC1/StrS family aminotransferase [Chloroflexi bacterium]|nr:DegT/DnrJ/EryC1/StrS family aminotransferase [Chloroflexota bacterium]